MPKKNTTSTSQDDILDVDNISGVLEGAFQAAAIGMAFVSLEGNFLKVNKSLQDIVGYSEEELLSKTFQDLTHPDDLEADLHLAKELLDGKIPYYTMEKRYFHRDGHIIWIVLSGSIVRDKKNKPRFFIAQIQDITERKIIEETLQEQRDLFENVIQTLPVGVWFIDKNGKIVRTNDEGKKIWAGAKYVGLEQFGEYKAWHLDTHTLIQPDEWAGARAITKGVKTINEEIEIECFDKTHKIILNSAYPLKDKNGDNNGAIIVNQDITSIKQQEEKILFQSSIIEAVQQAIIVIDLEGKIIFWNKFSENFYGWKTEEIVGKNIIGTVMSEELLVDREPLIRRLQKKEIWSKEYDLKKKDGSMVRALVVGSPLFNKENKLIGIVGVEVDISERLAAEQKLRNEKKFLEKFNKLMVGRELKMVELKSEIKRLREQLKGGNKV